MDGQPLTNAKKFGKRLRDIQFEGNYQRRMAKLDRLLELFDAKRVINNAGTVVGYRLPSGEWFCRKRSFHGQAQADVVRQKIMDRGVVVRSYECPQCGYWHLSKKLGRSTR